MKLFRPKIRRGLSFAWGRAWALRSKMIPVAVKRESHTFLQAHQENLLFVMSSGRSGTQLISDLLDASGKAVVFHEPNFREDVSTMDILRSDAEQALRYWQEFRSVEVYRRWKAAPNASMYGEVNGTIRYQAHAIKQLYPRAKMLLLARDGRGVVRSVMGWPQFYNPGSKGAYALAPLPDDPFYLAWPRMTRFEKVCWQWRDTNESLMRFIPPSHWLALEHVTSDFNYFTERFSRNVGIDIPHEVWQAKVSHKSRNASGEYGFPAWEEWSGEQQESFVRICGGTMIKLGYEI